MTTRATGAALLRAVVGAVIVGVWNVSLTAEWRSCQEAAGSLCFGPDVIGAGAAVLAVVIVSAVGLAVLQVRPLLASVPAALVVAGLT